MHTQPGPFTTHVFVCTNQKPKGECCAPKNAETLRRELKEWANSKPEWRGKIRINSSGCLDRCDRGIAIAIYPQNEWLTMVGEADLEKIKTQIETMMRDEQSSTV